MAWSSVATTLWFEMSAHRDLARGDARLRISAWRGDPAVAYLTVARGRITDQTVSETVVALAADGFQGAFSAALSPVEQAPFLAAGFRVHERLHLLARPLDDDLPAPQPPPVTLQRARRSDHPAILALDAVAFEPFWHLDQAGFDDAMAATPSSRLRVAYGEAGELVGYVITGRAGPREYLQRLAVDPHCRRAGIGAALVADGLRWLRRWGAREALVNTQLDNLAALALYERLGFRQQAHGLAVLHLDLREGW
jgi:ribosomal protein S18 acetylase RimI-like enzyme